MKAKELRQARIRELLELDQIDPHNITTFRQALQDFQHVIILKPAMAGRAGSGRNRGAECIDIDGDIVAAAFRNTL